MKCWEKKPWKSFDQLVKDTGRDATVYVKIPKEILDTCTSELQVKTLTSLRKVNIVCTALSSGQYPIEEITWPLRGTYLRPVFPSCIGKNFNPSGSWTTFWEGYNRCAGATRSEKAQVLFYQIAFRMFVELRVPVKMYNFSVQNIVTATTLPYSVCLEKLAQFDQTQMKYEPALFPGLIYHHRDPEVTLQVFESGNINVVGARRETFPILALQAIEPIIRKCRIYQFKLFYNVARTPAEMKQFHSECSFSNPNVLKFEHVLRKNKKTEKSLKEFSKKRKCELRALQQGEQELERARKRRKPSAFLLDLGLHATESEISLIRKRREALPPEIIHDDSVFLYSLKIGLTPNFCQERPVGSADGPTNAVVKMETSDDSPKTTQNELEKLERTLNVEVFFDGTVLVLNADDQEQANEAFDLLKQILNREKVHVF